MRIKLFKWSLVIQLPVIRTNEELDHSCLNQVMDGTYSCKWCEPEIHEQDK